MNDNTPIDEVIEFVVQHLGIASHPDFVNQRNEWVATCKKNLVFTLGTLRRLSQQSISKLNLPILLAEELSRIVATGRAENALFNLQLDNSSEETRIIYQREQRFASTLTSHQKELVRKSWHKLQSLKTEGMSKFSKTFYPSFFEVNPAGQRLFQDKDLSHQSRALTSMLGWVVTHLDNMPHVIPVLAQMGGRHELYGVHPEDYGTFGSTLAKTFQKVMGINDETAKAWEECINNIADLMVEAGRKVKLGYRNRMLRDKDDEWIQKYCCLTLDTFYIFRDEAFTDLAIQFSIRGVDGITFPESSTGSSTLFPFEIVSTDPPYTLKLAAQSERDFEEWMAEFDWRIRAIQRIYIGNEESESDTDVSAKSTATATKKAAQRTKKSVTKKKAEEEKQLLQNATGISLNEKQKEAIKKTWRLLCDTEVTNPADGTVSRAITAFFDEFYVRFFEVNPAAKRLFEDGMAVQSRAMVKMLSMIIKLLDNPDDLNKVVSQLGGRHEIYGVNTGDFKDFANAMCETLLVVLKKDCTTEARDAWFTVLMEISAMMQAYGKQIRSKGFEGILFRKSGKTDRDWKRSCVRLSLDTLYIYRDEKSTKIRASIPLGRINSIDIIIPGSEIVIPTEHAIVIESANLRLPVLYLATDTKEQCLEWVEQLNWRVQAVARVFKHDEEGSSESNSFEGSIEVKKVRKNLKSLQKKKKAPSSSSSNTSKKAVKS